MKKLIIHPCRVPLPASAPASTATTSTPPTHTKCIHGECMASSCLATVSSSTGYEPNIVGNNSAAGMIAKNDHQSTTTERSRTSRPRFYSPNMERCWEIRRILFSMSNTHCLSKLRSGARRDAMRFHHQRARFEDAARQLERAARDERQIVVTRTIPQVPASMQSRT